MIGLITLVGLGGWGKIKWFQMDIGKGDFVMRIIVIGIFTLLIILA